MKMLRASFAAILFAVSLAFEQSSAVVPTATTVTPTESPLAVVEHAHDVAQEHANQTLQSVMHTEQGYRHIADDEHLVDEEVNSIEAAVTNTTQHYSKQRKRLMHEKQHHRKQLVHEQVRRAKTAANEYKHVARELETQRHHAGLPESVYEGGYDHDERLAEGWHDEAENYGDAAENHIESFFDMVEGKIEQHIDEQRNQQRRGDQEDQEDQDWDQDEDEDQHGEQSDQHANQRVNQRGGSQQGGSQQGGSEQRRSQQHGSQQQVGSGSPDVVPTSADMPATAAWNLRAVAPNSQNDTHGFILTFACIGFLGAMVVAAHLESRSMRSQASEPLLGA